MRVFAISDVHTDFRENLQLLANIPTRHYHDDALILAGDVSHDLARLRQTLELLLGRFRHVFFVPGNHELWVRQGEHAHSVHKFHEVLKLCEGLGVHTSPRLIGQGVERVCIVPLFSWYTRPEEGSDSLFRERPLDEPAVSVWSDDYLVRWPDPAPFKPAPFFLAMNEARVSATYESCTISMSHFLPRADLMFAAPGETAQPRRRGSERHFNFSRVAGTSLLEEQIRRLAPRVHVYGHQHRNRCRHYDGIWYVSNCLAQV